MDAFTVNGHRTVDLLAVAPVDPVAIAITAVTFISGGGMGNGFGYGDPQAIGFPAEWEARRDVPATLDVLSPTSALVSGEWSRLPQWQAVIGVLPTSNGVARLSALRYTYRVDGKTYRVTGKVSAGLDPSRKDGQC